jgi:hypothetical protein
MQENIHSTTIESTIIERGGQNQSMEESSYSSQSIETTTTTGV